VRFLKKPISIALLVVLVGGGAFGLFYARKKNARPELLTVERGAIVQEVAATGTTKPLKSIDLAFERGGKISFITADVGAKVAQGQMLAELSSADLAADVAQDEATLAVERAKLDELRRGTRPEEIRIQEVKVANAETSLADAKIGLVDKIEDAYTKSDDAIRGTADQFLTSNISIDFFAGKAQLKLDLQERYGILKDHLVAWQTSLVAVRTDARLDAQVLQAKTYLSESRIFLERLSLAVNALTPTAGLTQTSIDAYKSDISTARSNINTAIVNLSTADEKFRSADSALVLAQNELALKKAGSTKEQIAAQEAYVQQAEARLASSHASLSKNIIRTPIAGIITKRNYDPGEVVAANTAVLSLISEDALEIEVFIPEVDIGKIAPGNPVAVTFDAFPGDTFTEMVAYIDPAETVVDGVVNFKTKIVLTTKDARLRSGLTANLHIQTLFKPDALKVPQFAIVEKNSKSFVRIPEGDAYREVLVVTGVRGQDGKVEIVSGLQEGDRVLNIATKTD
jgi:RND family efflux transporter MFP subunit